MQLSMQARAVPRRATIVLLIVLLAAAIVAIAVVGSARPLPDPFGPAANGRVAYLSNGQIYAANPDGSNPIPLTSGDSLGGHPGVVARRDQVRIRVDQSEARDRQTRRQYGDIVVANADGSNPITIDRETRGPRPHDMVARRSMAGLFEDRRDRRPDLRCGRRRLEPTDAGRKSRHRQLGRDVLPGRHEDPLLRGRTRTWPVMDRDGSNRPAPEHQRIRGDRLGAMASRTATASLVSAATSEATDLWFLYIDGTPEQQLHDPGTRRSRP